MCHVIRSDIATNVFSDYNNNILIHRFDITVDFRFELSGKERNELQEQDAT